MRYAQTGLLLFYVLWLPHSSQAFDCERVTSNGAEWNLSKLAGRRTVHEIQTVSTGQRNTTFEIDLCAMLKKGEGEGESDEDCKTGTRICAKQYLIKKDSDKPEFEDSWAIAGTFAAGGSLDERVLRLKNSESHKDSEREGLRVQFYGGKSSSGVSQRAVIELLCDKEKTGLEGPSGKEEEETREVDDEEKDKDGDGNGDNSDKPGADGQQSLQFVQYSTIEDKGVETGVLRLEWKTKYACEDQFGKSEPGNSQQRRSWGFFPWFVIIIFMAIASYLIFGSWLNYNRYGARGWDLLPHGDTIRDLPYLVKDWGRKVASTVQGSGGSGRGGYSAL